MTRRLGNVRTYSSTLESSSDALKSSSCDPLRCEAGNVLFSNVSTGPSEDLFVSANKLTSLAFATRGVARQRSASDSRMTGRTRGGGGELAGSDQPSGEAWVGADVGVEETEPWMISIFRTSGDSVSNGV